LVQNTGLVTIVIEDRDSLFGFDEVSAASCGYSTDELYDALLRRTFVPGRKRGRTWEILPTAAQSD
jgi:hypothetical protein